MTTFIETGIRPELVQAVTELGYENPMPIQEAIIPVVLKEQRDVVGLAQTGTGKTAAYGLPLLHLVNTDNKKPQSLILSPTRELCIQITNDLIGYSKYLKNLHVVPVYGGVSIDNQIRQIKKGVQVIVATPGRMNDLLNRRAVDF
jgi:ATP-dependent RNA helicase DeaD